MKSMKKILCLFLGCVLFISCYDEGKIKPSEEPELIYGKYTLPQGDHDYDDDIVAFYKKYGSLLLYKFTTKSMIVFNSLPINTIMDFVLKPDFYPIPSWELVTRNDHFLLPSDTLVLVLY